MLYLEDYLELIEHLPQELRDRLTYVRESDLRVNNSSLQLDSRVSQFFAEAKGLTPERRQCEYEDILKEYQKISKYADDKVNVTTQTHDIMIKLVDRLNGELEKFKLELEADHAGITAELEKRSLELDSDTRLDGAINHHLNHANNGAIVSSNSFAHLNHTHNNHHTKYNASGIKDRRKSEHKHHHRHHPYHQDNGYHKRAKFSQNEFTSTSRGPCGGAPPQGLTQTNHYRHHPSVQSRQSSTVTSPTPYGANLISSSSAPASVAGDLNGVDSNGGNYSNNLTSFGNNSSFMENSYKNLPFNQHSALSAALSSATPTPQQLNSVSALAMMNASHSNQGNKISINSSGLKDTSDLMNPNNPLVRQNPIAAAASQAIAATQQLQQGRRTSSLKASFAAINAGGLTGPIDTLPMPGGNRNALAPVTPDQQAACKYNSYGKPSANGNSMYIPVTKSGRPSKRPKHHASHLYPDESPTSISSDNSVFENSESVSSAEFIEPGAAYDTVSPASLDFNDSAVADQSGADSVIYQRDDTRYCICRQVSYGEMVACDNEECEIEWFHYNCVGVTQPPKGKWFCPDCTRKMDQHPTQTTQKKRGRKEKTIFNLVNDSIVATSDKSKDRLSSAHDSKSNFVST